MEGRIVKLVGGVYTILDADGKRHERRPRGKFRHRNVSPKVGDRVQFDQGFITDVEPRDNELYRPPIANVDQALLINAAKAPELSLQLLDRFLLMIEAEDITPVIVVNKTDLLDDASLADIQRTLAYYEKYYSVHYVSAKQGDVDTIKGIFEKKISVLAGQSGAGKSKLLNALDSDLSLKVGDISKALNRGKHTTRHVELLDVMGGLVADTPGFSKIDLKNVTLDILPHLYPDFFELEHMCKFRGCFHVNEPGCAVKAAVEEGDIPKHRYRNYVGIYQELEEKKRNKY